MECANERRGRKDSVAGAEISLSLSISLFISDFRGAPSVYGTHIRWYSIYRYPEPRANMT